MAQPATAGSVAVLLQANPNLTIPQIWYILTSTAYMSPTWGTAPNVTYGWGLIQLDAAVAAAQALGGTATPTVTGTPPTSTPTATRTNTAVPTSTATTPPPICGAAVNEGFEGGTLGVFTNVVPICTPGGCNWVNNTTNPHSGTRSVFAPDLEDVTDQYLELTSAFVPVAGSTFTFWHDYDLEEGFDGGVIEATTNGGTTWTDLGPNITAGGYDAVISTAWGSPIGGRQAWTGTSRDTGR